MADRGRVPIGDIDLAIQGRGFASICLVLSVPFIQPIPLPGLSIIVGLGVAALGARIALGQAAGLPDFLKSREIAPETLRTITRVGLRIFSSLQRVVRPRMHFAVSGPFKNLVGVSMMISGLAMSLPIPPVILFSNSLPAWAIIALSIGYVQRDGLLTLVGHFIAIGTWAYFALWWEVIERGTLKLLQSVGWPPA